MMMEKFMTLLHCARVNRTQCALQTHTSILTDIVCLAVPVMLIILSNSPCKRKFCEERDQNRKRIANFVRETQWNPPCCRTDRS